MYIFIFHFFYKFLLHSTTRENYDKFVGLQECFKDPYYLHIGPKDEMHYRHHCRLRNSNTLGFVKGYNDLNSNNGIYIDINVLDGWSSKKRNIRVQRAVRMLYSRMIALKHKAPGEIDGRWKWINYILKFISCFFSFSTIARLDYKNTTKYNTTSGLVGCIDSIDEVEAKFLYTDVSVLVDADFEGYKIPIPSNYDNVLKELYGDYMKFPPVEERGKYHEEQIYYDPDIPYKEYIAKYGYPL